MAKTKVNVNGGGARVLNVRSTPRPASNPSLLSTGRMQFPPGTFVPKPGGFEVGAPSSNPIFTGTLPTGLNQFGLFTRTYTNGKSFAQLVLVLADFGNAWKVSGSPVVERMTPIIFVDGVAQTPAGQEQFADGAALGTRFCAVVVKPGQTISVLMQVSVNMIGSTTGAFAFGNSRVGFFAVAAE